MRQPGRWSWTCATGTNTSRATCSGSRNIPVDELRFRLEEVPRGRPIVVHCRSGFRSHLALRILKEKGSAGVRNVTGGFVAIEALGGFDIQQS